MARVKLTAGRIREFGPRQDQKQSFLWDTEVPWLAVRATQGAKVFVFQGRIQGATLRIKIGDCAAWDIDQARAEARHLQTLIDQGIDPRQAKAEQVEVERQAIEAAAAEAERQATEAERKSLVVSTAWQRYLEERQSFWGERNYRDHVAMARPADTPLPSGKRATPGPLAVLMPLRLCELSAPTLFAWLAKEAATRPAYAALAYRHLRAFLRWCSEQPDYQDLVDPAALLTKRVREAVPTVKTKDDCLQKEQLKLWFAAARRNANPTIPAYLQILLLTGARREELANLTWANVDFTWKSLTIGDKMEGERVIPLTPYVAELLQELKIRNETPPPAPRRLRSATQEPRPVWQPSPWVFASRTAKNGRLQEPRIFHDKALAAAGLPPLSLHGLRRSFGTLAEWTECPVGVVAQIQGHKPSALAEKHYRRRPLDLLRKWHTAIEQFILNEAGIAQPASDEQAPKLRLVANT